jgi:hypothetical protein
MYGLINLWYGGGKFESLQTLSYCICLGNTCIKF